MQGIEFNLICKFTSSLIKSDYAIGCNSFSAPEVIALYNRTSNCLCNFIASLIKSDYAIGCISFSAPSRRSIYVIIYVYTALLISNFDSLVHCNTYTSSDCITHNTIADLAHAKNPIESNRVRNLSTKIGST